MNTSIINQAGFVVLGESNAVTFGAEDRNEIVALARPYVRVELTQGTPEWLAWRYQGIGSSDAATIMGENPYENVVDLMAERLTRRSAREVTTAMQFGVAHEPRARERFCAAIGAEVRPVCVQSLEIPWLRASLDGLSVDGDRVVEIKCGRAAYWRTVKTNQPPAYYYAQLQHILAVTGLPAIEFVCDYPTWSPIYLNVKRDDVYIARLLEAEGKFWAALEALAAA